MPLRRSFLPVFMIALGVAACGPDSRDDSLGGAGNAEGAIVADAEVAVPTGAPPVAIDPPARTPDTTMPSDIEQLAATIAVTERGLPLLNRGEAIQNIEVWQAKLRSSNNPALRAISRDLEQLQDALAAGDFAPATLGPLLVRIGEETTAVAEAAEPEVERRLTLLGTLLTRTGNQLLAAR